MVVHEPFSGYPPFLEEGAREIGHPESAGPARRIVALAALAHLCAAATVAEAAHVASIVSKAEEIRDQIHAVYRASERMLAEVRRRRGLPPPAATLEAPVPSPVEARVEVSHHAQSGSRGRGRR